MTMYEPGIGKCEILLLRFNLSFPSLLWLKKPQAKCRFFNRMHWIVYYKIKVVGISLYTTHG